VLKGALSFLTSTKSTWALSFIHSLMVYGRTLTAWRSGIGWCRRNGIREVLGLNLDQDTDSPDWSLPWFSWVNAETVERLDHDRFLSNQFIFIIHQSNHSALHTDRVANEVFNTELVCVYVNRSGRDVIWGRPIVAEFASRDCSKTQKNLS
jgi:hypothetical protein